MKTWILLAIVWVVLALTTLHLVVMNESSLVAALVAWFGGIITYRLVEQGVALYKIRHPRGGTPV